MVNSLRHLNALRAFEAAARYSSFAKAAGELNVSHSVISQHVKNLEQWLGAELFVRHGNSIEISVEGRALLPQVSNAFQTLRDACDGILRQTRSGTLTVSAEPAIASRWLRKRITEFCVAFPNVEIDLKPAWEPPVLGDGNADMIIHFETRLPRNGPTPLRLFPIDGYPACAPDLIETLARDRGEDGLGSLPLIHDNGREIWHQWFARHLPESTRWETGRVYSDLSLAIDAAVDGEGVILADDILCAREIESGSIKMIDDRKIRCVWYSIVMVEGASPKSAEVVFGNWLIENASWKECA